MYIKCDGCLQRKEINPINSLFQFSLRTRDFVGVNSNFHSVADYALSMLSRSQISSVNSVSIYHCRQEWWIYDPKCNKLERSYKLVRLPLMRPVCVCVQRWEKKNMRFIYTVCMYIFLMCLCERVFSWAEVCSSWEKLAVCQQILLGLMHEQEKKLNTNMGYKTCSSSH